MSLTSGSSEVRGKVSGMALLVPEFHSGALQFCLLLLPSYSYVHLKLVDPPLQVTDPTRYLGCSTIWVIVP